MNNHLVRQVRRVAAGEEPAASLPYDYADAFEIHLPGPDRDAPQEWVMAGMDQVPAWVGWIAALAGTAEEWRVVESTAEVVRLEQSDSLMHTTLVGRRIGPSRRRMTTVLRYRRPRTARLVWAVVGVIHRRAARYVVTSNASATNRSGEGNTGRVS